MVDSFALVGDYCFTASRILLELGATLVFAGLLTAILALALTWRPTAGRREAAEAFRAELHLRATTADSRSAINVPAARELAHSNR